MASAGTERTGRSPAPPRCRFCAVKTGKGVLANTRGLTAQLIQFQYTDAFYFYFAKPINEILSQTRSSEFLGFAEAVIESTRPKLQIAHYTSKDALGVLAKSASKHSMLANSLRRRNDRRPSIETPNQTPHPFLLNPTGMLILRKGTSRKNAGHKRLEEDAKEKRRAARCKEQMPLRDGDLLKGSRLFVDPESFETEMFDIYSPKFSSDEEASVLGGLELQVGQNTENVEQSQPTINKRPWAWTLPHPKPHGDVGKIEIPLLKLGSKQMTWEAAKLGMKVNTYQSDNQSTQFSSSYNPQLQAKVRRKQVLEDLASKISPGFVAGITDGQTFRSLATNPSVGGYSVLNPVAQIQNSTAQSLRPAARLDFSPKLNRKRQNKDKREKKGSDSDKDHRDHLERISRDPRTRNLGKSSLLNSNSWQMAQSWDQFIAKPPGFGPTQYLQVEDHSNTAPQSARGVLGKSQETFKAFRPYGRNSSRKAGPSPEITTDRAPGLTSGSFRDKIGPFKSESQQICLTKRLRRPMWISVGQGNGKNPSVKNKAPLMTSRTQDKSMQGIVAPASHSKGKSKERSEAGVTRGHNQADLGLRSGNPHFLEIKPKKNKPQNKSMGKLAPTKVSTATTIQFGPSMATRGAETSRPAPITFGSSSSGNFAAALGQKNQTQRPMMAARRMAAGAISSPHHSALVLSTTGPVPADCNNVSLFPHRLQTEGNKTGYMWPSQSFSKKKSSKSRDTHSFGHNMNSGGPFSHAIQFIPGLGILTAKKEAKRASNSRSRSITKRGTATSSTGALAPIQNGANLPVGLGSASDARKRSQSKKQSNAYLASRTRTD